MTLEEEAKVFIKKEPQTLHCNDCGVWSSFSLDNDGGILRGWVENDKGYFCNQCKHKQRNK